MLNGLSRSVDEVSVRSVLDRGFDPKLLLMDVPIANLFPENLGSIARITAPNTLHYVIS